MAEPVIARVFAVAAAGRAGLAVAADLSIDAQSGRLGLTAITVGLTCVGLVLPASKAIGRRQALELLLLAKESTPRGLFRSGEPGGDRRTVGGRRPELGGCTVFFRKKAFARRCTIEDAEDCVNAFMEKRTPLWRLG